MSKAGDRLKRQIAEENGPTWHSLFEEWPFHPTRKWRFDFAWPELKLAVEVDGGTYTQGRHTRGKGYQEDADKLNAAAILGWRVLRVTTEDVNSGKAIELVKELILSEEDRQEEINDAVKYSSHPWDE